MMKNFSVSRHSISATDNNIWTRGYGGETRLLVLLLLVLCPAGLLLLRLSY
jgi:hypothetical protein